MVRESAVDGSLVAESHRSESGGQAVRSMDLRLAGLHLRAGLLSLARAELETMAGNATLDDDGLLDLAEVRWRTGDLSGAGDAATAYLGSGRGATLGFVIAAEAQAALGRPAEARRLASRALERLDGSLDELFAGQPRASIWPADATPGAISVGSVPASRAMPGPSAGMSATAAPPPGATDWASHRGRTPGSARLDAEHPVVVPGRSLDGLAELDAARESLTASDHASAAIHLALALRLSPALAPAVLQAAAANPGPSFDVVRGDAYRLVGHEIEAQRAFSSAGAALPSLEASGPLEWVDPGEATEDSGEASEDSGEATEDSGEATEAADTTVATRVSDQFGATGAPDEHDAAAATNGAAPPEPHESMESGQTTEPEES